MNRVDRGTDEPSYRIGAVSRLTGVAPDTLRVWERRYGTVTPFRSATGTRLYSQDDVGRLALIKRLLDGGDAISCVANLSRAELEERARGARLPPPADGAERPCRVVVLGASLADRLAQQGAGSDQVELLGCFRAREALLARAPGLDADVLVLEYASIQPEQIREIGTLLLRVGAARALVVYGFAARTTLERLESPRIFPVRGPVDPAELQRWIRVLHARPLQPPSLLPEAGVDLCGPLPPRRFDEATLAKIAAAAVTVRCECPHHLVDLISSLTAFEASSEDCEVLNVEDAALHAFLHAATAQARALLESALARVVEADGIACDLARPTGVGR
jgi:DNA-binding transcriptional MerR regulator